ncbi:hypothetical protein Unana1_02150 [Umbelopsis nana]
MIMVLAAKDETSTVRAAVIDRIGSNASENNVKFSLDVLAAIRFLLQLCLRDEEVSNEGSNASRECIECLCSALKIAVDHVKANSAYTEMDELALANELEWLSASAWNLGLMACDAWDMKLVPKFFRTLYELFSVQESAKDATSYQKNCLFMCVSYSMMLPNSTDNDMVQILADIKTMKGLENKADQPGQDYLDALLCMFEAEALCNMEMYDEALEIMGTALM